MDEQSVFEASILDGLRTVDVKLDFEGHRAHINFEDGVYSKEEIAVLKTLLTGPLLKAMDKFTELLNIVEEVA